MKKIKIIIIVTLLTITAALRADSGCSLDHLGIGFNADGISGTPDDKKLFLDCSQKYRHSDPAHSGDPTWLHWHYPLYYNIRYDRYNIGEPGFGMIDETGRQLAGTRNVDYRIMIECVSITPGFSARQILYGVLLDEPNDVFNHSALPEDHLHLQYRAPAPSGGTDLHWITYRIYDSLADGDQYEPSEPVTVVFVKDPPAGDVVVDGTVDVLDVIRFCGYWLSDQADKVNDFYERADTNRDGRVNLEDLSLLTGNWLTTDP